MGPSSGSGKAGLVYMGSLTQNGGTGDMNKSLTCKGYSYYLVIAGLTDVSHERATVTSTSGTVERAMQDTTTVYNSYLGQNVTSKANAAAWEVKDCTKGDVTINIQCPAYVVLSFFIYGVA